MKLLINAFHENSSNRAGGCFWSPTVFQSDETDIYGSLTGPRLVLLFSNQVLQLKFNFWDIYIYQKQVIGSAFERSTGLISEKISGVTGE